MTCQEIYDITMALMDEMLDNGNVDYGSTKDYTARTPRYTYNPTNAGCNVL